MKSEKNMDEEFDDLELDDVDEGSSADGKDAYQMFLESISRLPKYSSKENLEKIKEYQTAEGEEKTQLLNGLVEGNIRLVVKCAIEVASHSAPNSSEKNVRGLRMDLIQEGSQALCKAIKDFDLDRGYAFSTLAVTYIKRAMYAFLNTSSRMIYLPQQILDRHRQIVKASDELTKTKGGKPSFEEIASYLNNGMTASDVEENCLIFNGVDVKTIDANPDSEDGPSYLDTVASDDMNPQEVSEHEEQMEKLEIAKKTLTPQMKFILSHRYPTDGSKKWTLRELSDELGLSKERIRQLENEALKKLRDMIS